MKRDKPTGFTLVELMIVVAIIGVLAALAIPAFLRYIQNSKASEAPSIMKVMATGAASYFYSDQIQGLAQPWHGTDSPGTMVGGSNKVFPGGETPFTTHTTTPSLGARQPADMDMSDPEVVAAVKMVGIIPTAETYFSYHYVPSGQGPTARLSMTACHGFKGNTDACTRAFTGHRYNVSCDVETVNVTCQTGYVDNEFD
jgi:prepilin-type N-terminal cleavage/methylation domain-containing protein